MAERPEVLQNPHMGTVTDPELARRMEVAALGWRLQNGAYDRDKTVADLLADATETVNRLRTEIRDFSDAT